jgi:hypothetical protein
MLNKTSERKDSNLKMTTLKKSGTNAKPTPEKSVQHGFKIQGIMNKRLNNFDNDRTDMKVNYILTFSQ